jgi:hypothetical protein
MGSIANELPLDLGIFERGYIQSVSNKKTAADIVSTNQVRADSYRTVVEAWDHEAFNGAYRGIRPVPPVQFIAMEDLNGDYMLLLDPRGDLVCEAIPLPDGLVQKPKPAAGHFSIGEEVPGPPVRRHVEWNDTMPDDSVSTMPDGSQWKKINVNTTPFGVIRWYLKVA